MHIITTGLGALFFLSASPTLLAAQEALEAAAAARLHAAQTDALCNYCGDYSNTAVASGQRGPSDVIFVSASAKTLAVEDAPAVTVAAQIQTAAPDALCNYCGDYSDAFVGSGRITTVYVIGIGYPGPR